jgi:hypothetical protein
METVLKEVIDQGFKPVIFIDSDLTRVKDVGDKLREIAQTARRHKVKVVYSADMSELNQLRKAYVFRYGYIPGINEAMVKRKGGKIVSGNF